MHDSLILTCSRLQACHHHLIIASAKDLAPCHALPQAAQARISSFAAIDNGQARSSHCSWSQWSPCQAPQPHDPDASVVSEVSGRRDGGGRNDTLFHLVRNVRHQARSARKLWLRRMMGCVGGISWSRSSILRRKDLPERTILHAWFNSPIKDSRSSRAQAALPLHCCS